MNRIEKEVARILENHGVAGPPVPVDSIAKKFGAKLSFEPFEGHDDISGILYRDAEHVVIGINSAHANNRQRFSIAHEIGHLILHSKPLFVDKVVGIDFRDAKSSLAIDREEIQANAFAAELLMPKEFIKNEIRRLFSRKRKIFSKEDLISELADIFRVSSQAMEYRLNNLGLLTSP
jgi:Zn-dependent peptidase ImmA (M78 family)